MYRFCSSSIILMLCAGKATQQCTPLPAWDEIRSSDPHNRRYRPISSNRSPHHAHELVQIVSPPPPLHREWVMVAGNETQVDEVFSMSISMGGRLQSIGNLYFQGQVIYYGIMHSYNGPVFIKPEAGTLDQLIALTRDNERRDMAVTHLCGQEVNGKVIYNSYWEYVPGIQQQLWFPGTVHAQKQKEHFQSKGLRLSILCGFPAQGEQKYIGVWQNIPLWSGPYHAYYGLPLQECLEMNDGLARKGFVAVQFSVFQLGDKVVCTGIWEHSPGHRHFIRISANLLEMKGEFVGLKGILPRQMSHFVSSEGSLQFVVLWNDINSRHYPDAPPLWNLTRVIPSTFLRGSSHLLRPHQTRFVVDRLESLMRSYDLPAVSIAISKNERLKFAAAFGYADIRSGEEATPSSVFRIGSVSKPLTAAAVLLLVENGLLHLDLPLFGNATIFGNSLASQSGYGKYVELVTTRHLMEHTTGGWDNEIGDVAWSSPSLSPVELARSVLSSPLPSPPGHSWVYSNFGYLLLGLLIERLTRLSYEEFVYSALLKPIGARQTFVAKGSIAERGQQEVIYYMSGSSVGFDPYGGWDNLQSRIGPWGGWVASPIQLLKFIAAVDGGSHRKDLLSKKSIVEWSTPTEASNRTYGMGWSINVMGFNGWQHDGRMPGASAMVVKLDSGHSIAITTNKEYTTREFFHDIAYLFHHLAHQCDWWNDANDLFIYT